MIIDLNPFFCKLIQRVIKLFVPEPVLTFTRIFGIHIITKKMNLFGVFLLSHIDRGVSGVATGTNDFRIVTETIGITSEIRIETKLVNPG